MVPIRVLRNSTTALMIVASIGVGVAMFDSGTFLTQFFQLAGGHTPTRAGLMTIPLIVCQMLSSTLGGQLVSRTGRWKPLMIVGSILLVLGLVGLGTIDRFTPYWHVAMAMSVLGLGVGALIQNIVLAVQNTVDVSQIGASSATISFFRSLGGAVGVSVLGAILANHVTSKVATGLSAAGVPAGRAGRDLDLSDLPGPVRAIVRGAYGDSFGILFLIAAAFGVLTLLAVLFVREVPLRNTIGLAPAAAAPQAEAGHQADEPAGQHIERHPAEDHRSSSWSSSEKAEPERSADDLWDDPSERLGTAAVDVLTVAKDQACQHLSASDAVPDHMADRVDQAATVVEQLRHQDA